MLMNRQLAGGGWNYGNTSVYGRKLYAQPDQTGVALLALRPYASREEVYRSLGYLKEEIGRISTPLSLGWGFLGLEAWGNRPPDVVRRVQDCADRQMRRGTYNTQEISILLVALSKGFWLMEGLAQR